MSDLAVLSPEKTVITFPVAALGSRVLAQVIDLVLYYVVFFICTLIFGLLGATLGEFGVAIAVPLMMFGATLGPFLYFILFEALWNGQTIGKKTAGIRVRMADGTPLTFAAALGRNLLRPADFLPGAYFFGLIAMFTNPRSQRIGDLAAGTVVVHDRRVTPRFTPAPYVLGKHPWEDHVGDLRTMTQEEYFALKKMCDRFPELAETIQDRMLRQIWHPIATRLKIETPSHVHPIYLAEAVVMKFGRSKGLM
ncbi:MAG: RDD family protein [Fimbriimonadaceae bacterium]